ncbi:MAG: sulfotransferase, partial [Sphingomicrobium sp.]
MNDLQRADPTRPRERAQDFRESIRVRHQAMTDAWRERWREEASADGRPAPTFLVGFPRSGTTLLDTMLMGHPKIEVLEEEPTLNAAEALLPNTSELPTLDDELIRRARDAYFRTAASLVPMNSGNLLIDKNPLSMNLLPIIRRLFPVARLILAIRHPCDVVLSCFMANFKLNAGMSSFLGLDTAAELYDLSFRQFERAQELFQLPMHTVIYENVVADRERELRSLFEFLGLDWSDEVLDHQSTAHGRGRIKTASYAQVVEPIYTRSAGRWRHYRKHLEPIFPVLQPWIDKFGYDLR